MVEEIRKMMEESADPVYKEFHQSLVPGLTSMVGVRMPKLREIAKKTAKTNWQQVWEDLSCQCYEELMLKGLLIGYGGLSRDEQAEYLNKFIPQINNWAICDCSCSTWKFMRKDSQFWFSYLDKYFNSENEYEIRAAVVSILDHFIVDSYIDKLFPVFNNIHHEGYYVKMAVAWAISVCYVKFPQKTKSFLEDNQLDDFTQNKSIQKIRESYRVEKEEKDQLLKWKRP